MLKIYGYKKCSTCLNAMKVLKTAGYNFDFIDVTVHSPSVQEIEELLRQAKTPLKTFFNITGQSYRQLGLKDKLASLSDAEKISLLASDGKLIKRPIISDGKKATVGFGSDQQKIWGIFLP